MRSIKKRYEIQNLKEAQVSSFIKFTRAIKGKGFSKPRLIRMFNCLVDKDDYNTGDKKEIIKHLLNENTPEAYQK